MEGLNKIDWIALSFWLACWVFYGFWSSKSSLTQPSLMGTVAHHRRTWMREAYQRENRITDSALVNNLMQSATFFSSTTILILGALVAVLGSLEHNSEIVGVVRSFPLARQVSAKLLEFKTLVLSLVFVYAFLRFTMSLRQFNLINILIGAFPAAKTHQIPGDKLIDQAARLNELAGNNFTQGLRAELRSANIHVGLK